jgi:hypothetical protein
MELKWMEKENYHYQLNHLKKFVDVVIDVLMKGEDQLEIENDHVEHYLVVFLLQL